MIGLVPSSSTLARLDHVAAARALERRGVLSNPDGGAAAIPTRTGHALLTIEARRGVVRYGLLGGKGYRGETFPQTAAREAIEETGHALSTATARAIGNLDPRTFVDCALAVSAPARRCRVSTLVCSSSSRRRHASPAG